MDGNGINGIIVRRGTEGDAGILAEVGAETFYESYVQDIAAGELGAYVAEAFGREKQEAELAEEGSWFFIAETGGEVVGYARLLVGAGPEGVGGGRVVELQRIYVRQAWIGRGVGAALMHACLATARQAGFEAVWLGVWERNTRAIAFYKKWGFEAVGEQGFEVGGERHRDVVMRRAVGKND